MTAAETTTDPRYLTTKEVADLLRVRERKVYDLAAAGEIPHLRVTGKLLFPKSDLMAWIEGAGSATAPVRPDVLAGSHDPLLDWAVRESGCGLASLFDGSSSGLDRFRRSEAALCGLHIPDAMTETWNIDAVSSNPSDNAVLISWAVRVQGLIVHPDLSKDISGISDLRGRRVIQRQAGAGARVLFDKLIPPREKTAMTLLGEVARTETDAALAVASGEADAALGLEAAARQFRLGFVPLAREKFDLLIDRRSYFTPAVQTLLNFARGPALSDKAASLGGYDLANHGEVRWLAP